MELNITKTCRREQDYYFQVRKQNVTTEEFGIKYLAMPLHWFLQKTRFAKVINGQGHLWSGSFMVRVIYGQDPPFHNKPFLNYVIDDAVYFTM